MSQTSVNFPISNCDIFVIKLYFTNALKFDNRNKILLITMTKSVGKEKVEGKYYKFVRNKYLARNSIGNVPFTKEHVM